MVIINFNLERLIAYYIEYIVGLEVGVATESSSRTSAKRPPPTLYLLYSKVQSALKKTIFFFEQENISSTRLMFTADHEIQVYSSTYHWTEISTRIQIV